MLFIAALPSKHEVGIGVSALLPHPDFTCEGDGEMRVGIHVDTSIGRKELVFTLRQHGQHSHKAAHHT